MRFRLFVRQAFETVLGGEAEKTEKAGGSFLLLLFNI